MIRVVVENILLFLLPTLIYAAWMLFQRSRQEPQDGNGKRPVVAMLDDAPLLWLFATGAILVIVTLTVFGSFSGGQPGQQYTPSIFKDGKIQPSHIE